ncbi:MAG: Maf family protein, partial [Oscillospiraceae bacterium]|nr:Maf family protein [Oscillospiraceae bacterium]
MALILASGSPRRRELMHLITDDFTVKTTDADETLPADRAPEKAAEALAVQKAKAAAELYPEDTV